MRSTRRFSLLPLATVLFARLFVGPEPAVTVSACRGSGRFLWFGIRWAGFLSALRTRFLTDSRAEGKEESAFFFYFFFGGSNRCWLEMCLPPSLLSKYLRMW